jgi:hypothetical protein
VSVMIFIDNKYTHYYFNIINNAKSRKSITGYTEKHHIIPKSLGGSDNKNNLVTLTNREHYICHRLLTKMTENEHKAKMIYALYCMVYVSNKHQNRYIPNSRYYQIIKEDWRKSIKGRPAHNKGKPMSEEQKEKLRQHNIGKQSYVRTEQHLKLQSNIQKQIYRDGSSLPNHKGKIWINNGTKSSFHNPENPIPAGWIKGRIGLTISV